MSIQPTLYSSAHVVAQDAQGNDEWKYLPTIDANTGSTFNNCVAGWVLGADNQWYRTWVRDNWGEPGSPYRIIPGIAGLFTTIGWIGTPKWINTSPMGGVTRSPEQPSSSVYNFIGFFWSITGGEPPAGVVRVIVEGNNQVPPKSIVQAFGYVSSQNKRVVVYNSDMVYNGVNDPANGTWGTWDFVVNDYPNNPEQRPILHDEADKNMTFSVALK